MIVRQLEELKGTDREVHGSRGTFVSNRLLLRKDSMGFSLHETIIFAGTETRIWYKNHLEAVYCIEGEGELELVDTGELIPIRPGTMYALSEHEKHDLRASKDLRLICVFNPPLTGREDHDAEGTYPLLEDD